MPVMRCKPRDSERYHHLNVQTPEFRTSPAFIMSTQQMASALSRIVLAARIANVHLTLSGSVNEVADALNSASAQLAKGPGPGGMPRAVSSDIAGLQSCYETISKQVRKLANDLGYGHTQAVT